MHELVEKIIANPFEYLGKTFKIYIENVDDRSWFVSEFHYLYIYKQDRPMLYFKGPSPETYPESIKEIELVEE